MDIGTANYVIMNGIKKLKKLIYTKNGMGNCKISKIGDIWIKSDFRLICGYFFVTGNHNKTENEILSFRRLLELGSELPAKKSRPILIPR
jgi:hypothetical protein